MERKPLAAAIETRHHQTLCDESECNHIREVDRIVRNMTDCTIREEKLAPFRSCLGVQIITPLMDKPVTVLNWRALELNQSWHSNKNTRFCTSFPFLSSLFSVLNSIQTQPSVALVWYHNYRRLAFYQQSIFSSSTGPCHIQLGCHLPSLCTADKISTVLYFLTANGRSSKPLLRDNDKAFGRHRLQQ